MSGITVRHSESDVEPACSLVFGAGRLCSESRVDSRVVKIAFKRCYFVRIGARSDNEGVESLGYRVDGKYQGERAGYIEWRAAEWRRLGYCPNSGFYVAEHSEWLNNTPGEFGAACRHFVVDGRDGYVELLAQAYSWREWVWTDGHRRTAMATGAEVAKGEGPD